ncbi:unnamed protein product [Euphydryas editha]|uniref:CLIP domain-containing serine protease n=1 Tax=Euphydryas editha TaxID=104508 RepID=A0AAU9U5J5_EUPED|nr:unnamed protein product [Euphydryas editha]
MDILCKNVFVIFLFAILSAAYANDSCKNNASCVVLEDCRALYPLTQQNNNIRVLKELHCGFDSVDRPKICCPPSFTRISADYNPVDLLPDFKICGIQNNDRIFGGTQTDIDEHPWMALLQYKIYKRSVFLCAGVLISSKYVMTAAHCVTGEQDPNNWKLTKVRFGEWNVTSKIDCYLDDCSPPVLDVPVEEIIPHADYNTTDRNRLNDIALIRLAHAVEFSDFVKPICLPITQELRSNSFEGYNMEVAGWGQTESRHNSDVKMKVRVPIVKNNKCQDIYRKEGRILTEKQICAGGLEGQDSCRGDSGGPLMGQVSTMENWMVTGIVSYGPSPCGTVNFPSIYTRVTAYIDWILSNIRP